MDHPKTYTLTRGEWLAVNRVLAAAMVGMAPPRHRTGPAFKRWTRVLAAKDILSASYQRAAKKTIDGGAEAGEVPSAANLPPAVPPEFVK